MQKYANILQALNALRQAIEKEYNSLKGKKK
jgi:hypothetical protein